MLQTTKEYFFFCSIPETKFIKLRPVLGCEMNETKPLLFFDMMRHNADRAFSRVKNIF